MLNQIIVEDYQQLSEKAFEIVKEVLDHIEDPVIGLVAGSTPVGLYKKMVADHNKGRSYKKVHFWSLNEYCSILMSHDQSTATYLQENLFYGLDTPATSIKLLNNETGNDQAECIRYEEDIRHERIDLMILGLGSDGHLIFNEPGTPFESMTHISKLTEQTRTDNQRFFFNHLDEVPTHAMSVGLSAIMRAKKVLVLVSGEKKAEALEGMLHGPLTEQCPASLLQTHPNVVIICDRAACEHSH